MSVGTEIFAEVFSNARENFTLAAEGEVKRSVIAAYGFLYLGQV